MKKFLLSILFSLTIISVCHSANKRYWICSLCKESYCGEKNPPTRVKCAATKYQRIHEWKELQIGYSNEEY